MMYVKNRRFPITMFYIMLFLAFLLPHFSRAIQLPLMVKLKPIIFNQSLASSSVFIIHGNVYPRGYYTTSINIGNPPKRFELDIDTGSDLTWVECDQECKGCTLPKDQLYKPHNNFVSPTSPICASVSPPSRRFSNEGPNCNYEVKYTDDGSSKGALVWDYMPISNGNGTVVKPPVAIGCGYDQEYSGSTPPHTVGGVFGLGKGKISILSQLTSLGLIRNVVGHCLSSKGGGFLYLGDTFVPHYGVVWVPMIPAYLHYCVGPADLLFDGKPTSMKDLQFIFDSGSTYTYLNSKVYQVVLQLLDNDLKGKPLVRANNDPSLPICWKGEKAFSSLQDLNNYFKPLAINFPHLKNSMFQLPPQTYLIISQHGNACLGILNGAEVGLGDANLIGDISLQDKVVIYDNDKQQIGWTSSRCDAFI